MDDREPHLTVGPLPRLAETVRFDKEKATAASGPAGAGVESAVANDRSKLLRAEAAGGRQQRDGECGMHPHLV